MIGTSACGPPSHPAVSLQPPYPATGLALLSPNSGSVLADATIGSDPVAVIVSDDGGVAYMADSAPGDVYAVGIPALNVRWRQHVGGAPFGLLLHDGRLLVSLYSGNAVAELDPTTGDVLARDPLPYAATSLAVNPPDGAVAAASDEGYLQRLDGGTAPADHSFALTVAAGSLWTADYLAGVITRVGDPASQRALPSPVHPFWLAPGAGGTILIAAEGEHEDSDRGAVYAYDVAADRFTLLDEPNDPDEVLQWGPAIVIAAHGSRRVDVINEGKVSHWAPGVAAVAIAPDSGANVLVVALNAHE